MCLFKKSTLSIINDLLTIKALPPYGLPFKGVNSISDLYITTWVLDKEFKNYLLSLFSNKVSHRNIKSFFIITCFKKQFILKHARQPMANRFEGTFKI